jgi:carboxymethylenebutenolidase
MEVYKEVPYFVKGKEGSELGIIVLQEWWGLNQHIKNMTKRFSEHLNALAITPDLYRGKVVVVPDEAKHMMTSLDWQKAVEDIQHACEYLKSKGCKKIGVVGFCMGGALVIASVSKIDLIDCGVCFYGIPGGVNVAELKKPMQFHFGDMDKSPGFSDIKAADGLRDSIKKEGLLVVTEKRHADEPFVDVQRSGNVAEFHRYVNLG